MARLVSIVTSWLDSVTVSLVVVDEPVQIVRTCSTVTPTISVSRVTATHKVPSMHSVTGSLVSACVVSVSVGSSVTDVTEVPQECYLTVYHVVTALTTGTELSEILEVREGLSLVIFIGLPLIFLKTPLIFVQDAILVIKSLITKCYNGI